MRQISLVKGLGYRILEKHIKNNPLASYILAVWMNTCKMWDWLPGFNTWVCFNPSVESISVAQEYKNTENAETKQAFK